MTNQNDIGMRRREIAHLTLRKILVTLINYSIQQMVL